MYQTCYWRMSFLARNDKLFLVIKNCLLWAENAGGTPGLRNLVKGVTRYISGYLHEGKGKIFRAIVSHLGYAICYNRNIE